MEEIAIERDAWADFLCECGIVTQGSARNHSRYIIMLISKRVSPFLFFALQMIQNTGRNLFTFCGKFYMIVTGSSVFRRTK